MGVMSLERVCAGFSPIVKSATTMEDEETKMLEVDDCGDLKLGLGPQNDGVATKGI